MADLVKKVSILQSDGTYDEKNIGIDYQNIEGISSITTNIVKDGTNLKITKAYTEEEEDPNKRHRIIDEIVDLTFVGNGSGNAKAGLLPAPSGNGDLVINSRGSWVSYINGISAVSGGIRIQPAGTTITINAANGVATARTSGSTRQIVTTGGSAFNLLTAGTNVSIDGNGVISAVDTKYTAGSNISINNGVISATNTTYSAGTGLSLNGTQFKNTGIVSVDHPVTSSNITFTKGDGSQTIVDLSSITVANSIGAEHLQSNYREYTTTPGVFAKITTGWDEELHREAAIGTSLIFNRDMGKNAELRLQHDGNLTLYLNGEPVWTTNTHW